VFMHIVRYMTDSVLW